MRYVPTDLRLLILALTQSVYTTLSVHSYSLVANNLTQFIMEQTFYQFGELYLRWTDKEGNIWEAVKEQVDFFGKEFFEWNPEENPEGECTEENPYKYIDDWKEEHPNQSAVPFPEWI